ncbi:hypothetical protein DPEC_G00173780 [Dallia pectoralis]|uniref:Uncharacterized protein n=1 Tax=Dallia pectoralis TaxID=75939 RepID=A0ACC2GDQ0_DALPE|nr:hypothetical protein DPEC_G00173780 [Dallia pectoralis]
MALAGLPAALLGAARRFISAQEKKWPLALGTDPPPQTPLHTSLRTAVRTWRGEDHGNGWMKKKEEFQWTSGNFDLPPSLSSRLSIPLLCLFLNELRSTPPSYYLATFTDSSAVSLLNASALAPYSSFVGPGP